MFADPAFWDGIAEDYAAKPVDDPDAFERKIAITTALLEPDSTVLDIGCGTGSLALRLAPHAGQVHALDISGEMVRIGRAKAEAQGVENVTFHQAALHDWSALPDGSVDVLCAYSILHLVEDRGAALAQVYRLLRPGGHLVSSTVVLAEGWVPYRPILTVMRWLGKAPSVHVMRRATLLVEVRRAGFEAIEQPDVGAKPEITFLVARKPAT